VEIGSEKIPLPAQASFFVLNDLRVGLEDLTAGRISIYYFSGTGANTASDPVKNQQPMRVIREALEEILTVWASRASLGKKSCSICCLRPLDTPC
jgi:hypothetical protein